MDRLTIAAFACGAIYGIVAVLCFMIYQRMQIGERTPKRSPFSRLSSFTSQRVERWRAGMDILFSKGPWWRG
jgi:hypothetical protein